MAGFKNMGEVRHYAITVTYDGSEFHGSQLQPKKRTVQEELEKALSILTKENVRIAAAGRTDSGVSAEKQIFTFLSSKVLELQTIVNGLNFYLPEDVAVRGAWEVETNFSARYNAKSRTYIYNMINTTVPPVLERKRVYWVRRALKLELMQQAAALLLGERDFAAFQSGRKGTLRNTVRHMYRAEIETEGERLRLIFEANSFLTHQVRNMAGAILSVGLGDLALDQMRNLMENKIPGSFLCLPPYGLLLKSTNYEDHYGF